MKLYGLIGYPLGHSFSKKYFTSKFKKEGITDCEYELFPIPSINELPSLVKSNPSLKGLNVTIPFKKQVLLYVTEKQGAVNDIGAANTIKITGNNLRAYNTDVIGFEKSFIKKLNASYKKALILGTGGSSKAVQYVLNKLGIEFLLITSKQSSNKEVINYSGLDKDIFNDHQLIINCTPVGMYPKVNEYPPIPYQFISDKHYLFDLVYTPDKTMFLQKGEERGAIIQNGYDMLIIQAEESWKIWNED